MTAIIKDHGVIEDHKWQGQLVFTYSYRQQPAIAILKCRFVTLSLTIVRRQLKLIRRNHKNGRLATSRGITGRVLHADLDEQLRRNPRVRRSKVSVAAWK